MTPNPLKRSIVDALSLATEFVETFESLPNRHCSRDRSVVPDSKLEASGPRNAARESAPTGSFVASTFVADTASLNAIVNSGAVALAAPVARVLAAIAIIVEFQQFYVAGRYATLPFREFRDVVATYTQNAFEALERADSTTKAWLAAAPVEVKRVGTLIGDVWYLSTDDVATLTESTRDAARKLIREKGLTVHRIGRRNYVNRDEFLAATL